MNKVLIISVLVLKLCLSQDLIKDEIVENHNNDEEVVCYRGGCSGEICSHLPDQVSPCIYKPEYECYKEAMCEPQCNGTCGFTVTPKLVLCLIRSQIHEEPKS